MTESRKLNHKKQTFNQGENLLNQIRELIDESKVNYSFIFKNLSSVDDYRIRPNQIVSSASTIKLFIMAKVFQQIKTGNLDLKQTFTVTEAVRIEDTLPRGAVYSIEELIILMISRSDNIAANLLIDAVGMQNINLFIKELGILNTVLQRKMLDFDARKAGKDNLTTASDLTRFLELLYLGKVINPEYSKVMLDIMKKHSPKPWWSRDLPGEVTIAHKDGNLEGIEHDAGIVFTSQGDYIFTLLTWDCKDDRYRKKLFTILLKHRCLLKGLIKEVNIK